MRRPLLHWLLLAALVVMWGSSFLLTKIAVSHLPPPLVVSGRLTIAAVVLLGLVIAARRALPGLGRVWLYFLIMALLGNGLPFLLISWGQQRIASGLAGILMAVMPLATLLLAHYFVAGERLTRSKTAGFGLGFLGIVVLMGPEALTQLQGSGEALLAELAVLGGALCYALNTIVARRRPPCDAWVTAAVVLTLAALLTAPLSVPMLPSPLPTTGALVAVLALGLVCTAAATVVYFQLIQLAGPTFLSLINYLIPLWAVVLGIVFLGERLEWNALAALLLILGGIGLSQRA